ncbi:ERMES complex subunit [Coemansia sp. RSA 2711]|nr:ERMES complex subunit [Coemansia sp. RSA 2711]
MSFKFQWTGFPPEFSTEALEMLTQALNKGENKPPNLVGPIVAKELDLGSTPPELDILEISELEEDRFRAMFRMKYEGDGYLVLQTQVQANPLRLPSSELPTMPSIGVVAAAQPLVVPMLLRISGLKLNGIVVLAVSKHDGITLVFRSDPLVSVEVHSTFDSVPSVRRMLQREIEATLRSLFQEDLPVIVHEMSVNEIKRAREAKDRERREHIERRQQQIRQQHARADSTGDMWAAASRGAHAVGSDSGAASVGSLPHSVEQRLLASQLHQRLMELSREEESAVRRQLHDSLSMDRASVRQHRPSTLESRSQELHGFSTPPTLHRRHRRSLSGGAAQSVYPESLERYLSDDWERMQQSAELDAYLKKRDEEQQQLEEQRNGVVLRPADSAVAARMASLMSMGHTISPYTRRFEHTTMRSDVNPPRFGHPMYRHAGQGFNGLQSEPGAPIESDGRSPPLSPGASFTGHGSRQPSFSAGISASTPFSAFSPPSGGVRSPFSRNRTLRRKVHRIGGISLSKGAAGQ